MFVPALRHSHFCFAPPHFAPRLLPANPTCRMTSGYAAYRVVPGHAAARRCSHLFPVYVNRDGHCTKRKHPNRGLGYRCSGFGRQLPPGIRPRGPHNVPCKIFVPASPFHRPSF